VGVDNLTMSGDDSTMRGPSSLVGRGPLLAGLRGALDAALAGHGSLVLITGEPGIGKTALVTVFANEAAGRGVRVAWSRCAEGEGVPAFWPWTQVLRATEGLPGREDHLAPPAAERTREAADRFRIFDRAVRHLAEAAAENGLLAVLDDLHWADPDSLGLLEFAARQLAASRLLLVGAYRDDDAADRLRRAAATAAVIRLEGLDTTGVGALMAQITGGPVPEEAAAAMHTRTGGNPLFVRELTRLLQSRASAGDRWASSATVDSVREVIDRRLARLSQPSTRMLTVAALDGARLRPWLLARVLGTAADIPALLEEAAAARVLVTGQDGFRFAHDLFREVLAAELPLPLAAACTVISAPRSKRREPKAPWCTRPSSPPTSWPQPPAETPTPATRRCATRGRRPPTRRSGWRSKMRSLCSSERCLSPTLPVSTVTPVSVSSWTWPAPAAWPGALPSRLPPTAMRSPSHVS
jgi:predicted ATPase